MKNPFALVAVMFLLFQIGFVSADSYPSGITGRTKKSGTTGCASCHTQNTSFAVTINGPSSLTAGATGTYTVTMSGTKTGVDIAASSGTLAPGSNLQLVGDELTHKAATNPGTFTFTYTAPPSPGQITLYATGANTTSTWNFAANATVTILSTTGIESHTSQNIPDHIQINQNYPNPFNPSTTISFAVPMSQKATITIFDITGKKVSTLIDGVVPAGTNSFQFNGSGLPSGIYFYRIQVGQISEVRRMVLLK